MVFSFVSPFKEPEIIIELQARDALGVVQVMRIVNLVLTRLNDWINPPKPTPPLRQEFPHVILL